MAWLDDLEARANQSVSSTINNVGDWLDSAASDAVVKVGDKALGNQSALEIAQGQAGNPVPLHPGQGLAASNNAMPYPTIAGVVLSPIVLVALGFAAYYLLKKR